METLHKGNGAFTEGFLQMGYNIPLILKYERKILYFYYIVHTVAYVVLTSIWFILLDTIPKNVTEWYAN